jgi:hypothetical protein
LLEARGFVHRFYSSAEVRVSITTERLSSRR